MSVERVLSALASLNKSLTVLAKRLRSAPGVTKTSHGMDVHRLPDGIYLDAYVEAELTSGNTLIWWLETHDSGGAWIVTPEVRIQTDQGQDLVRSLTETAVSSDELPETLVRLAAQLASTAEEIDIGSM